MESTRCFYFYFILSILSVLFFLFPDQVLAHFFSEEFDSINTDSWVLYENDGVVSANLGRIWLSGNGPLAPYVHDSGSVDIFPDSGDFSLKIIFSYPSLTYWGVGIGIGSEVPSNDVSGTTSRDRDHLYSQFGVWQDLTSGLIVYYRHCNLGVCESEGSYSGREVVSIVDPPGELNEEDHVLEIDYVGSRYYIYFDRSSNPDPVIISDMSDEIPKRVWFGNPIRTGGVPWTSLSIDSVLVQSLDQEGKNKVVLLPGLGGSWNTEALITGVSVADEEWKLTPFYDGYSGLISTFEANGYVEGEDLFVYTYDWRDEMDDITSRLSDFLSDNFDSSDEVDLVGHSLGGLVARNYEQQNNDSRIDKVVTLGAPHRGVIQAYGMWAGGQIGQKRSLADVALGILLELQSGDGWNGWEVIRNEAPIVKDIMPSFDFAYKGIYPLSLVAMDSYNDFLVDLELDKDSLFPKLEAVVATGFETPRRAYLGQRTFYDQVLGLWPDGHLLGYGMGDGDEVVIPTSAGFEGDSYVEIETDHRGLVDKEVGVDTLMNVLGLEEKEVSFGTSGFSDTLLFLMGSPARLEILTPGGEMLVSDDQGIVSLSPFEVGIYEVSVIGEADGVYHLLSGVLDKDLSYLESEINLGEVDVYLFSVSADGEFELLDPSRLLWLGLAKDLVERKLGITGNLEGVILNIEEAEDNASDCSLGYERTNLALADLFLYRFTETDSQKRIISERVVGYLIRAGVSFGECMGTLEEDDLGAYLLKMRGLKSLVNAKLRLLVEGGGTLSRGQVEAYKIAEGLLVEVIDDLFNEKYWEAEMKLRVVELCLAESLGV